MKHWISMKPISTKRGPLPTKYPQQLLQIGPLVPLKKKYVGGIGCDGLSDDRTNWIVSNFLLYFNFRRCRNIKVMTLRCKCK
jgi:hypothetical protein